MAMGFLIWFHVEVKAFELSVVEGGTMLLWLKGVEGFPKQCRSVRGCCLAGNHNGGVGSKRRGVRVC